MRYVNFTGATWAIWTAAAAAPLLLLMKPDFVDWGAACLFVGAVWLCLIPMRRYVQSEHASLPLFVLTCLFYLTFFVLPPFVIERGWWTYGAEGGQKIGLVIHRITTETGGLVFGGIALLLLGYYGLWRVLPAALSFPALPRRVPIPPVKMFVWAIVAAELIRLSFFTLRSISPLTQALEPLGYFAIGMLFVFWLRGHLGRWEAVAFWAVVLPLKVAIHLLIGLMTPIILLFVFLATLYWFARRRMGPVAVLTVCCIFFVFPVIKMSNVFMGSASTTVFDRAVERIEALGRAATVVVDGKGKPAASSNTPWQRKEFTRQILRRISLVVLLQYATDWTPSRIPYLTGETLTNLVTNWIPRLVWPDKPTERLGQEFGHKYRILFTNDNATSINLPWLIEFYINFGVVGVLAGMFATGALMSLLEWVFLRPNMTEIEIVAGWALVFRLFYQESNISLMLGGFLTQAIFFFSFLYAALWFIGLWYRPPSSQCAAASADD